MSPDDSLRPRPVAVVYSDDSTGPADGDDTGAVAAMLARAASWNFDVITAGPNGTMSVRKALARPEVRLYAQPGADGDDDTAYRRQKRDKSAIKQFIHEGGRYLGICMGGFLAPGTFPCTRATHRAGEPDTPGGSTAHQRW